MIARAEFSIPRLIFKTQASRTKEQTKSMNGINRFLHVPAQSCRVLSEHACQKVAKFVHAVFTEEVAASPSTQRSHAKA
jgi:hypothetical protein